VPPSQIDPRQDLPGEASSPHRHPGPVFGYVIEGDYEWAIDDNKAKVLKAGDTFYRASAHFCVILAIWEDLRLGPMDDKTVL